MSYVSAVDAYIRPRIPSNMLQPNLQFSAPTIHLPGTPMHFTALRLLSIVASLVVLSKAYSDDVFEARDYIDDLSTRADASLSSLSTRELIAELSERLDRRKVGPGKPVRVCDWCQQTERAVKGKPCEATVNGKHKWWRRRS
ncbi:hypothetical protein D9611_009609 [Ephemerocybe angulata]|uniref:Uncharacterized protein n=1 Tax=Ephemerocybe angulata TaxID=980116 RepID=A0A8H5C5M1_9AGAR|nr:hypothetical protein D9611_009609 [Tulosesus angulatus]